jgi:hypothetical protein
VIEAGGLGETRGRQGDGQETGMGMGMRSREEREERRVSEAQ